MFEDGTMTLGVNYWADHAATRMWSQWNAEEVEKDFKVLADHGVKVLRVFPTWNDFQPICAIHHAGRAEMDSYETRMFETEEHCLDTPAGYAGVVPFLYHADCACGVPLVHHLRLHFVVLAGFCEFARLPNVVRQRLLNCHVLAALHGVHCYFKVRVVGGRDANGVDVFAHLVEHFAVVGKKLCVWRVFLAVSGAVG